MRNLEGLEVGILVGAAALVLFLAGFWLPKPLMSEPRVVILRAEGCQVLRLSGMLVKDMGSGLCTVSAKFSAISLYQSELEFSADGQKKTTITIPDAQVAGYIHTTDHKELTKHD